MIGIALGHGPIIGAFAILRRMADAELALFAHVARRPDAELDLARAALMIAEPEYPSLDVARYIEALDELGAEARIMVQASPGRPPIAQVLKLIYDELGFHGNADDYYDPRNSFLNEVIDRRMGIPITLAVLVLEIARRAGVEARGVSFPGHFLVRVEPRQFVDPFDGRILNAQGLRQLAARATGQAQDPDPRLLEPVPKKQILLRMLNNLRAIWANRGDQERLARAVARMELLATSSDSKTPSPIN